MHPYDNDYLSKMLPGFEKKPEPEPTPPPPEALTIKAGNPVIEAPAADPAPELFDSVAAFISKYLLCDQHQLTVLALWVIYSRAFRHFPAAVYLNLRSPEPQSGKTRCLAVLSCISANTSFAAGISPGELMRRLLIPENRTDPGQFNHTVLLDDCHHTFSSSERQACLALLNSGSSADSCYPSSGHEYCVFGPKAFAGNAPLPASLALRCIPITLVRKKPSDAVSRFDRESSRKAAANLVNQLSSWADRNRESLAAAAQETPPRLPLGLSPREQACAEPLIHIADLIGGDCPEQARTALSHIFKRAEGTMAVELLCDLRALFYTRGDPEYISTKDILAVLRDLEHRPWSGWSARSGKKLGSLLHPFGIHSRNLQRGSEKAFRGYLIQVFKDAWERYVPPVTAPCAINPSARDSAG